jgi:hypothetical protein
MQHTHKNIFVYNSIMLAPIHLVLVSNENSIKELSIDMQILGFERCRPELQVQNGRTQLCIVYLGYVKHFVLEIAGSGTKFWLPPPHPPPPPAHKSVWLLFTIILVSRADSIRFTFYEFPRAPSTRAGIKGWPCLDYIKSIPLESSLRELSFETKPSE